MTDREEQYSRFASSLHFFEFVQQEYYEPEFNVEHYEEALDIIEAHVPTNEDELASLIREHPRLFDVIEQIFQLRRFTNAHYLNFLFDVELLNRSKWEEVFEYLERNIELDEGFKDVFAKELEKEDLSEEDVRRSSGQKFEIMSIFKRSIDKYSSKVADDTTKSQKHRKRLHKRIKNVPEVSQRIAAYLFNQRGFAEFFQSIKPRNYLEVKRTPVDAKSYSGDYGLYIIERILADENIPNIGKYLVRGNSQGNPIKVDESNVEGLDIPAGWTYASELFVEDISKRDSGKLKKFDYILFKDNIPRICIETNFYTTTGTKIGINEGEYRMLNEDMEETSVDFWWVTDGNYWLSNNGRERYIRCVKDHCMEVYNYNQFKKAVNDLANGTKERR